MTTLAWLDGELTDAPTVAADDPGLLTGEGVFTTALGRLDDTGTGQVRALTWHLARIARDADALGLPPVDADDVRAGLRAVLAPGAPPLTRLRVTRTAGGRLLVTATAWTAPSGPPRVGLAPWPAPRHPLVGHKTTSYAVQAHGRRLAAAQGLQELLLVTDDGLVAEAVASSVACLLAGEVVTPPAGTPVLAGTTVAVLAAAGLLARAPITLDDLVRSDGVLLLSSLRGVEPVAELFGAARTTSPALGAWLPRAHEALEATWQQP